MREEIRVVVVGEEGTGKSSLIMTFIKEEFLRNIQKVIPEVTIPPEVTPENVTTHLIDTSSTKEGIEKMEAEVCRAHVVIVVYSVVEKRSFERVQEYWIPKIREIRSNQAKLDKNKSRGRNRKEIMSRKGSKVKGAFRSEEEIGREKMAERRRKKKAEAGEEREEEEEDYEEEDYEEEDEGEDGEEDKEEGEEENGEGYVEGRVPIILVGNKVDLRNQVNVGEGNKAGREREEVESEAVLAMMKEFKEIETSVESSAKEVMNVAEIFYFAQRAVIHPIWVLYDTETHKMKSRCIKALERIFWLSDKDGDGILNDEELNEFQKKSFNVELSKQEIKEIKKMVEGSEEAAGISKEGFDKLFRQFIQRGRVETTWMVLRKFGYEGDGVELRREREELQEVMAMREEEDLTNAENRQTVVELSAEGVLFITEIFRRFDRDNDAALNRHELDNLYRPLPRHLKAQVEASEYQGKVVVPTNQAGNITLQGWLALWNFKTYSEWSDSLRQLIYLGYPKHIKTAIKITNRTMFCLPPLSTSSNLNSTSTSTSILAKTRAAQKKAAATVSVVYVIGPPNSGKSSLLKAFVKRPFSEKYEPTHEITTYVNTVEVNSHQHCLILYEFGPYTKKVLNNSADMACCDLLVFAYDVNDPSSFSYIEDLRATNYKHVLDHFPSLFVGLKADLPFALQSSASDTQPSDYITSLPLPASSLFFLSSRFPSQNFNDLFVKIARAIANPLPHIPSSSSSSSSLYSYSYSLFFSSPLRSLSSLSTFAAILATLSFYFFSSHNSYPYSYPYSSSSSSSSSSFLPLHWISSLFKRLLPS